MASAPAAATRTIGCSSLKARSTRVMTERSPDRPSALRAATRTIAAGSSSAVRSRAERRPASRRPRPSTASARTRPDPSLNPSSKYGIVSSASISFNAVYPAPRICSRMSFRTARMNAIATSRSRGTSSFPGRASSRSYSCNASRGRPSRTRLLIFSRRASTGPLPCLVSGSTNAKARSYCFRSNATWAS